MSVSVLTIARGRADHLGNVVLGLTRQTQAPDEMVIACMQDTPYDDLPDAPFPIRQVLVPGDPIPLAAARNAAAKAATGDALIFVDVDCIPGPTLVADYALRLDQVDGLLMGEVMYLPRGADADGWDYDAFDAVAVRHSDRQGPPGQPMRVCEDYRCFWSLSFAIRAGTFARVGRFDERYVGYGGEDTDFGKSVDMAGVPILWIQGARVYHQYHAHHMPPVHHIRTVIRNSEYFASKWGYRTMEHWLYAFRLMGLLEETAHGMRLTREPTPEDLALTQQHVDAPYANTASVIRMLKGRLAAE